MGCVRYEPWVKFYHLLHYHDSLNLQTLITIDVQFFVILTTISIIKLHFNGTKICRLCTQSLVLQITRYTDVKTL
jgi:hypothetical protein